MPIGNIVNKLVFSLYHGERNILFNGSINDESKIMYVRNPRDRVQAVAPWLTPDSDPYPAVVDGRVQWIVDGYTTLENYPYSQRTSYAPNSENPFPWPWTLAALDKAAERFQAAQSPPGG